MPATPAQLAALQEFFGGAQGAGAGTGVAAGVSSAVKDRIIGRVQVRLESHPAPRAALGAHTAAHRQSHSTVYPASAPLAALSAHVLRSLCRDPSMSVCRQCSRLPRLAEYQRICEALPMLEKKCGRMQ